ncbi:hypothetical protein DMUE_1118 [Dictyocoela muelleri]|nr:hypothetical protein DMUE_1118 [Dictyocoela muelleri]
MISDEKLIFIDESGFNLHMDPRFEYSQKNTKAYINVPNSKGKNVSFMCAISIHGIYAFDTKIRSFTSECFIDFIKNKLPALSENKTKYIIMDNASIHKTADVKDALISKRYILKFLPPYSPQLNPIENFFFMF